MVKKKNSGGSRWFQRWCGDVGGGGEDGTDKASGGEVSGSGGAGGDGATFARGAYWEGPAGCGSGDVGGGGADGGGEGQQVVEEQGMAQQVGEKLVRAKEQVVKWK